MMRKKLLIFALIATMVTTSITPVAALGQWTENQTKANQIAVIARAMGLPDTNPIIKEASNIWWAEEHAKEQQVTDFLVSHEADIKAMAGVMFAEARGLDARECSMIAWTILNRYDAGYFGSTLSSVIWADSQFAHSRRTVNDQGIDLVWLAGDVMTRWYKEKYFGETNVGRTLPAGYFFYWGDGHHNYFRTQNGGKGSYNFGLVNPYV